MARPGDHKGQYISKREMGVGIGRATTRAHPPHPLPARPYYTANRPAMAVYRRGRGGCGRGDGALVAARPCPPSPLFSLIERYWATARVLTRVGFLGEATWAEVRGGRARRVTCPPDR